MDLDGDQKMVMFAIGCFVTVIVLLISCITYYNIEKNNMVERMVDKGVSPAVLECVALIRTSPDHEVCRFVLTGGDLKSAKIEGLKNGQ